MLYWLALDASGSIASASPSPSRRATEIRDDSDPELAAFLAPSPETPAQVQARMSAAIQARLDAFARERLYDGILSLCTYAASTDAAFAAEGQRGVDLRDATWRAAWAILADVLAGARAVPTLEQLFSELPALEWDQ